MENEQKQNSDSPQQLTPSSSQRVIQPAPAFAQEMQSQPVAAVSVPTSDTPAQTVTAVQQPNVSSTNLDQQAIGGAPDPKANTVPQNVYPNTTSTIYTSFSQSQVDQPKKHWLRWGLICAVFILVIGFVVLLATNTNLRATVLRQKLVNYAYTNEHGDKYSILFYRNSTIQSYSAPGTTGSENILVSPITKPYVVPIYLYINGKADNVTTQTQKSLQQAVAESNNCTEGFTTQGFSVYIPSLNTSANFCTNDELAYQSFFGTRTAVYFMQIEVKLPSVFSTQQGADSNPALANQILSNKLNVSDLQKIVASFKPQS